MASADVTGPRPTLRVVADKHALARAAAEAVVQHARDAIARRGRFLWVLSGGSTPAALYALLASEAWAGQVDWLKVHVFWGDERCVPPDDAASNCRMARSALLDHVPIPASQIHRMRGEDDPTHAAAAYETLLRSLTGSTLPPRFDLVLLGMGADGHTASLFPNTAAIRERQRFAVAHQIAADSPWRITLTPLVFNAAAAILLLVSGADKAAALQRVLEGPLQPDVLPAQVIAPRAGSLQWLVDRAAAGAVGSRQ